MTTQQKRSESTRAQLCAMFRKSLLQNGLEATTTGAVLKEAGLSKGAMYHHFGSKLDIVEAIYRDESHGAIKRAVAHVAHVKDPIARLKQACEAWLIEMEEADVARIVLEIGPAALGYQRVLEIESEESLKLFEASLQEAIARGQITLTKPALAARLINAMVGEVASQPSADRADAVRTVGPAIDAILSSLK